jgi:hypothetical protein
MYNMYCAVCYGVDGRGKDPAAEAVKGAATRPDAARSKSGGEYPSDHVRSAIEGDVRLPAHGSKEMPV